MKMKILSKNGHKIITINRRKAIRENCKICSGWNYKEVDSCDLVNCRLYPYRTGKGKQNAKARFKAIRQYCLWCCANQSYEVAKCPVSDCPLHPYRKGTLERSPEIMFLSEKHRIEPVSETIKT